MKLDFELRKRLADRILIDLEEYKSLHKKSGNRGLHFQDIAINASVPIYFHSSPEKRVNGGSYTPEWNEETEKHFRGSLIALRRYLNLLRDFPDFREGEFSDNKEGAFPDLVSESHNYYKKGYDHYGRYFIDLATNRLRGRSNRQTPSTHPS